MNDQRGRRRASDAYLDDLMKIVNQSSDLPFVTDSDLKFTFCGAQSYRVIGMHPEEVMGHSLLSLLDNPSENTVKAVLEQLNKSGGSACIPVHCIIGQNCYLTRDLSISSSIEQGAPSRYFGCIKEGVPSATQSTMAACEALKRKVENNISTIISTKNKEIITEIFEDIRSLCDCVRVEFYEHLPEKHIFNHIIGTSKNPPKELPLSNMSSECISALETGATAFGVCDKAFGIAATTSCVVIPAVESSITWGMLVLVSKDENKMWDKIYIDTIVSIFRMIHSLLWARRSFKLLLLDRSALIRATKQVTGWLQASTAGTEGLIAYESKVPLVVGNYAERPTDSI